MRFSSIELDCDARVVGRHGFDPFRYAELLMAARTHGFTGLSASLALGPGRSALGRRVDALVTNTRVATPRAALVALSGMSLVALMAMVPPPSFPRWARAAAASGLGQPVDGKSHLPALAASWRRRAIGDTAETPALPTRPVTEQPAASGRLLAESPTALVEVPPVQMTPSRLGADLSQLSGRAVAATLPKPRLGSFRAVAVPSAVMTAAPIGKAQSGVEPALADTVPTARARPRYGRIVPVGGGGVVTLRARPDTLHTYR